MKPIPAIIAAAVDADLDAIRKHLHVEMAGERDDVRTAERHEAEAKRHIAAAVAARESARQRRIRIGGWLAKARGAWPTRGPNAKGWGSFLKEFGISEDSALRYIEESKRPAGGDFPQDRPSAGNVGSAPREQPDDPDETCGGQYGVKGEGPVSTGVPAFRQLGADDLIQAIARLPSEERARVIGVSKVSPHGASGEKERGAWCTPEALAAAVGPWDLDPFTNPRSHIAAAARCMLEDGGDGFGDRSQPGSYRDGRWEGTEIATAYTRVWIQPPYERGFVRAVVDHYKHTRFCALLRWSPDVEWFAKLWPHVKVVAFPTGERIEFEPPPNVETTGDGGAPFPHALFYADERDVTDEVRAMCLVWRVEHPTNEPAAAPMSDAAATTH